MTQCFDVQIAEMYGINAALLLQNIAYWVEYNRANDKNFFDGYYWTYNSRKSLCAIFPYLSAKQIETAVQKLIDAGLVLTGNFNEKPYDRTLWYTLTKEGEALAGLTASDRPADENVSSDSPVDEDAKANIKNVKCISQKGEMDFTKGINGNSKNVKPIPNILPNIIPDINLHDEEDYKNSLTTRARAQIDTGESVASGDITEYLEFSDTANRTAEKTEPTEADRYIKTAWKYHTGRAPNATNVDDLLCAAVVNKMQMAAISEAVRLAARNASGSITGYACECLKDWASKGLHTLSEIFEADIQWCKFLQ